MKINRIPTRVYLISEEAERGVTEYLKGRAKALEAQSKGGFSFSMEYRYAPVLVFSAIKRDIDNPNKLIYGLENRFHLNLTDGSIYVIGGNARGESSKGVVFASAEPVVKKINMLLQIADLTP